MKMVVHIVMFAFKDENKEANLKRVKEALEALPQKIETLKSMEVGIDFNKSDRAMDLVLTSTFEDKEGLKDYATHPAHLEVVQLIKELTTASKVVDYTK
jgi:quinol monooxygenase YgiN